MRNLSRRYQRFSRYLFLPFLLVFLAFPARADECIRCHLEMEEGLRLPAESFTADVHQRFDLTCVSCHGGNAEEEDIELAKDDSFKGAPARKDIPAFCGTCHSDSTYMRGFNPSLRVDQLELYRTSRHGKVLEEGDPKAAVCTDCHNTHRILESSHPKSWVFPWNIPDTCGRCHTDSEYMKPYGIPTDQVDEYKQSVHARALFEKKDLSAPVCNDCHGNHGATPPEVKSVAYVCRQCHPSAGELFSASPHKEAFDALGIFECEACHGNHSIPSPSDDMLGTGEQAVCMECHDPGSRPYQVASRIREKLDAFKSELGEAESLLERADNQGVEVSEPRFKLQEARTVLIQVRNLIHAFSLERIETKLKDGNAVVEEVISSGHAALKEASFRKQGLIVATVFLFLLAMALLLKIKQLGK